MSRHNAKCTAAQKAAAVRAAQNVGMNEAQLIRLALRGICTAHGIDYPDDLQERGKYDRSQIDWQKLSDK